MFAKRRLTDDLSLLGLQERNDEKENRISIEQNSDTTRGLLTGDQNHHLENLQGKSVRIFGTVSAGLAAQGPVT